MKYCPTCKEEFTDELKTCPDCEGSKLVKKLEGAEAVEYYDRKQPDIDFAELVMVYEGSVMQVKMMQARLELEKVTSYVEGGQFAQTVGLPLDNTSLDHVKLMVHLDDEKKARKEIKAASEVTEEELTKAAKESTREE